jgi:ubiquinone/menaquinone biosynthesis C-methylase UbiE
MTNEKAHGTTPGLHQRNSARTADQQARFLLPYLSPGMSVLDFGCGTGTIDPSVTPNGLVAGIDHDAANVESGSKLVSEMEIENVAFKLGDVKALPFDSNTFDVVFENSVFSHLADPIAAAKEIFRVLKPGGRFAARDVNTKLTGYGNLKLAIEENHSLLDMWQLQRGSGMHFGQWLPEVLREAGFENTVKSVSSYDAGIPPEVSKVSFTSASCGDRWVPNWWFRALSTRLISMNSRTH